MLIFKSEVNPRMLYYTYNKDSTFWAAVSFYWEHRFISEHTLEPTSPEIQWL